MDLSQAKRSALRTNCNYFKRAIQANLEDLSYELYTARLIPSEVRNRKSADEIVSVVENRLGYDESAWDTLIEVIRQSDGGAELARRLTDQLTVELSSLSVQQLNRGASCMLYNE